MSDPDKAELLRLLAECRSSRSGWFGPIVMMASTPTQRKAWNLRQTAKRERDRRGIIQVTLEINRRDIERLLDAGRVDDNGSRNPRVLAEAIVTLHRETMRKKSVTA